MGASLLVRHPRRDDSVPITAKSVRRLKRLLPKALVAKAFVAKMLVAKSVRALRDNCIPGGRCHPSSRINAAYGGMNARRPENERALRGAPFANLMHILVGFARLEGILSRETDEDL